MARGCSASACAIRVWGAKWAMRLASWLPRRQVASWWHAQGERLGQVLSGWDTLVAWHDETLVDCLNWMLALGFGPWESSLNESACRAIGPA